MTEPLANPAPYPWGPEKYGIERVVDFSPRLKVLPKLVSVDVENNADGSFAGIGFYDGGDRVFFFTRINDLVKAWLNSAQIVGQNFKSDMHKLREWGVEIRPEQFVFDTRIASYTLNSRGQDHGLKEQAKRILEIEYPKFADIVTIDVPKKSGEGTKKAKLNFSELPLDLRSSYNGMDCIATWKLAEHYEQTLTSDQRWYFNRLMQLERVLYKMERSGIKIDTAYLEGLDAEFQKEEEQAKQNFFNYVGAALNPNSSKQVLEALNKLGFKLKGTDQKKDLAPIKGEPVVAALIEYKQIQKLRSTYTRTLADRAKRDSLSRVHTDFSQSTDTGRLASSDPNLQNIPTRSERGKKIRQAFVPEEGKVFVVADYSQIDLRVLAHESAEPALVSGFLKGIDPHVMTAATVFKKPISEITEELRHRGKTLNFTMTYGGGGSKVAADLGLNYQEGAELVTAFNRSLPGMSRWAFAAYRKATTEGTIKTLMGRVISIPELRASDMKTRRAGERLVKSYHGQGGASDVVREAMVACDAAGYTPLLQVHDELVFEVVAEDAEQARLIIENIMRNIVKLRVPLDVKAGIGKSWLEAKH